MGLFGRRNGAKHDERETAQLYDAASVRDGRSPRAGRAAGNGTAVLERDGGDPAHRDASLVGTGGQSIVLTYDGWRIGELQHWSARVLDAMSSPVLYLRTDGRTREIDRDEVIMVVPPPLTEISPLRIAKQPIDVKVDIGIATVRGKIHVLAGVGAWDTWQRSTSGFVAITGATLDFKDGTTETAEVALVSRHAAHAGLFADEPEARRPGAGAERHKERVGAGRTT